jgi:hypothetical protein
MKKNIDNLSVVWISHVSQNEDNMMQDYFDNLDTKYNYEKIVVGHTVLDPVKYNFKYIPFWEHGLEQMALLGFKKNLGVYNATKEYTLVVHADTYPMNSLFKRMETISLSDLDVVSPIGYIRHSWGDFSFNRGLTWADSSNKDVIEKFSDWKQKNLLFNHDVRHKLANESAEQWTYISGAAIFSKTSTFKQIGWNNNLAHVQGEDIDYSQKLKNNGYKLMCDPELEVFMYNAT